MQESSSFDESSSWEESSSAIEDSSTEENPAWEIVDALYELKVDEYLEGTHTLTGQVTKISGNRKIVIHIVVEGRENKPIQCYNIKGSGVSSLQKGDIVTVSGRLTNYQGIFEFDNGCQLVGFSSGDGENFPSFENDPYADMTEMEFYENYSPARNADDAFYRSLHGFMSGELTVPEQAPTLSSYQPKREESFIRNDEMIFSEDGKAYTVVDGYGNETFTVYRDGGYITLEEVAAFVYAFGTYPANYTTSKKTDPSDSVWGEYLRLNHTSFSGSTKNYPYEPVLPNISGCGGSLSYFEMDIGTTGTDCDPSYPVRIYNDGNEITRGAARIVYGKNDLNGNGIYEVGEFHLFYTYNHYNDFQEYLNYAGGWGEKFGNITGGGVLSSTNKAECKPTPYVSVLLEPLPTIAVLTSLNLEEYKTLLRAYI